MAFVHIDQNEPSTQEVEKNDSESDLMHTHNKSKDTETNEVPRPKEGEYNNAQRE